MSIIIDELKSQANPTQAKNSKRFFKTGKGEYGEGDGFLGLKVPQIRSVVKKYWKETSLEEAEELLHNKYHEVRLCVLLILVKQFQNASKLPKSHPRTDVSLSNIDIEDPINPGFRVKPGMTKVDDRKQIFDTYTANAIYINNWDLVDLSAPHIVGAYLEDKPKDLLYEFAKSNNLWQKRIAILATFYYIYNGEHKETIKIAKILLHDKHDLIHKAVGWMLREVGKRCNEKILTDFLDENYQTMPRTMLRYAIERLPIEQRLKYLSKYISANY